MQTDMAKTKTAKSLRELYDELGEPITPKKAFIQRIANATGASEFTVRMWINGRQTPLIGIQKLVEQELGIPAEVLFPKRKREELQEELTNRH